MATGTFRTKAGAGVNKGKNASWTTADGCDGTLIKLRCGRVSVSSRARSVSHLTDFQ